MNCENVNLSKSKIFLICCLFFVFGIAVASFLPLGMTQRDLSWFAGIVGGAVVLALFWQNKAIRTAAFAALFLFFGIWRYSAALPAAASDKIWNYNGRTVTVIGAIAGEPESRRASVKYLVEARSVDSRRSSGKILITAGLYPRYRYGDELELICDLTAPKPFNGFSYDRYLSRYDIYSLCYYPKIKLLNSGRGNGFYAVVFEIKNKLRETVNYGLSEPESSLARAIVLGDKKAIPDDLRDYFSKTGVSHIAAISGMHIGILSFLAMSFFLAAGMRRKAAFCFTTMFLAVYIILIGLPVSAMRAGFMVFLVLWALSIGRLNKTMNSLVFAAAVLLLANPKLLRDDVGFQLSFLAVFGIFSVYPALTANKPPEPPLGRRRIKTIVRDMLVVTLAAQMFTLPIIAFNFSRVSIIAPLANTLIVGVMPFLLAAILCALILGLAFPHISFLFFLPAKIGLGYIIKTAEFLSVVPGAYLETSRLWAGWIVLYYAIVVLALRKIKRQKPARNEKARQCFYFLKNMLKWKH